MEDVFSVISLMMLPFNEMRKFSTEQIIWIDILKMGVNLEEGDSWPGPWAFWNGIRVPGITGDVGNVGGRESVR